MFLLGDLSMNMGWFITILGIFVIGAGTFLTFYGQHLVKENRTLADTNTTANRPSVSVTDSKCSGKLGKNRLQIDFNLKFKNVGKHPAENLRMRVWAAPLSRPDQFKKCHDSIATNVIHPEETFSWNPKRFVPLVKGEKKVGVKKEKIFMYIRFDYHDTLNPTNVYDDDLYVSYTIGSGSAGHSSAEQKSIFQKHLEQLKKEFTSVSNRAVEKVD